MATDTDDEDIVALQHQNEDDEDFDATQRNRKKFAKS
jgi:hypothetical protein